MQEPQENNLNPNPLVQFEKWYQEAINQNEADPAAMTLSTVSKNGYPSARTVLYKGLSEGGFLFFTNYESRKGAELFANPRAALTFYWPIAYRQVRIEGKVEKLSYEESDIYFQTRPHGSQISAWASPQSQVIEERAALLSAREQYQAQYKAAQVPCPEFWGGFRLVPAHIEFWLGRSDRLHDRFAYDRQEGTWDISRLAP